MALKTKKIGGKSRRSRSKSIKSRGKSIKSRSKSRRSRTRGKIAGSKSSSKDLNLGGKIFVEEPSGKTGTLKSLKKIFGTLSNFWEKIRIADNGNHANDELPLSVSTWKKALVIIRDLGWSSAQYIDVESKKVEYIHLTLFDN
jgi:hypothetical protein